MSHKDIVRDLYNRYISKGKKVDSHVWAELSDQDYDVEKIQSDLKDMKDDDDAVDDEEDETPARTTPEKKDVRMNFVVSYEVSERIKQAAWKRRISVSQLLRDCIQKQL